MNFVKSLSKQLASKGIRVNGVAPGPVWTPLQVSGGAFAEKQKKFGSRTALERAGMPAELAGIYVLLPTARPALPPVRFMDLPAAAASLNKQRDITFSDLRQTRCFCGEGVAMNRGWHQHRT